MTYKCSLCGTLLDEAPPLPPLSSRRQRIYDTLRAAGKDGVPKERLCVAMYEEHEAPTPAGLDVMRVHICDMNKLLRQFGWNIKAKRKTYFLLKSGLTKRRPRWGDH